MMLERESKKNLQRMNKEVPLLFVAGKEDASVAFGKSVEDVLSMKKLLD